MLFIKADKTDSIHGHPRTVRSDEKGIFSIWNFIYTLGGPSKTAAAKCQVEWSITSTCRLPLSVFLKRPIKSHLLYWNGFGDFVRKFALNQISCLA
jgi:hypothetical protein